VAGGNHAPRAKDWESVEDRSDARQSAGTPVVRIFSHTVTLPLFLPAGSLEPRASNLLLPPRRWLFWPDLHFLTPARQRLIDAIFSER
jgi:hypothetical protein